MAIQATSEEQLRLKKRARQRLLGAATLLISAAIILPMVLDQAPRSLDADIKINMPAVAPAVNAPIPVPVTPVPNDSVVDKSDTPINAEVEQPVAVAAEQKKSADAKLAQQQKEHEKNASEAKALAAEKVKQQAEQARLAHAKEVTHQAELAAEKARQVASIKQVVVPAIQHEPQQTEQTAKNQHEATGSHYVVQLGVFSSAENARQLRERLNTVGISTYTEILPSGATRVRAGPFTDRGQAEKVLAKIGSTGLHAQIVPLANK